MHGFHSDLWPILSLSLQVSGAALFLSTLAGVPLGAWLGLSRFPGKRAITALVYTGMGLPPVVVGLVVYMVLSRSGPLAELGWLFTPQAMILAQTLIALPLVAGLVMGAVATVPPDLILQVRSLGATPWQVRWAVLREVRTGVLFAVLAAFGRIISEVGAALMVGGNIEGQTRVLTTAIVLETGKGEFGLALILGGWLVTLTLLVNLAALRLQGETGDMTGMSAYQVEALSLVQDGRKILDLPRFEVQRGEVLCLVGPPGAGKSTLLRLLAGLAAPTSGRVLFGDHRSEVSGLPVEVRRQITLVFQRPALLTGTVLTNVEYGLRLRGRQYHPARAREMLDRVHLSLLAARPAHAVSGGEAQLVALARALAVEPEVLLLDEPTNNLDPARVALVEEVVLADHRERGTTVVWVTHNHFQARRVGDRVALLLDGRFVEVALTEKFFDEPQDPRTAAFVQGKMVY